MKLWSDEQLIKSLPRYQHMKNQSSQRFDVSRFVDIEARINLIKSETAARFSYDRVKTATLNYEHRQALIKSLEDKSKRASYEGNLFAKSLLEKEIEEIVSH
ncbi:hypothetical protein HII17_02580 [Thalassotalea sp. M1531]|uniref:Uncharacterized protein n=1 Tax=Thalassotalea algicola TaxID=2716224 RepID=A0A7Y0Q650_9GAMM|nr:hypothetical protein [Thalassotalea algicola]NMP30437.1 hypothetical protein [Thalassotalea algicola]